MAQNITLLGASYSAVPAVNLPKTGGGTATFTDTTIASNAASAADILAGKMAWVNGTLITGTGSGGGGTGGITQDQDGYLVLSDQGGGGGGGGGLEYEQGTWTPSEDTVLTPTISFTQEHSELPIYVALGDSDISTIPVSSWAVISINVYSSFYGAAGTQQAIQARRYAGTTSDSWAGGNSNITALSNYVTTTQFSANTNASTADVYWRASRTYKWIAIWPPTT